LDRHGALPRFGQRAFGPGLSSGDFQSEPGGGGAFSGSVHLDTLNLRNFTANHLALSNLLSRFEESVITREHLDHPTHGKRMEHRLEAARKKVAKLGKRLPKLYEDWQRIKQTGVTFIRWFRAQIFKSTSWEQSLALLRRTYDTFKA